MCTEFGQASSNKLGFRGDLAVALSRPENLLLKETKICP